MVSFKKKLRIRDSLLLRIPFNYPEYSETKYYIYPNNLIDGRLIKHGGFEKHVLGFYYDVLTKMKLEDPLNEISVLDVGACTGHHSIFLSRKADFVRAFEPDLRHLYRLIENLRLNTDITNVTCHNYALSDTTTFGVFDITRSKSFNSGTGSLEDTKFEAKEHFPEGKINIHTVTGDRIVDNFKIKNIRLIKIDTEGSEKKVLQGLSETINSNLPIVHIELSFDCEYSFESIEEVKELFPDNYEFLKISNSPDKQINNTNSRINRKSSSYYFSEFSWPTKEMSEGMSYQVDIVCFPLCLIKYSKLKNV